MPDEGQEIKIEEMKPTGEVKIDAESVILGDNWCQKGSNWDFKSTTPEMDASAQWTIKGLMTSGEYQGLCHVEYKLQTAEGDTAMDYYFAEDGKSGYFEIKLPDGSTMKQEWTG